MTKARDLANAADALDDVSATELGYVNGVTSAIQTQLNNKQAVVSGVDDTEIGYLNGVTSAIQTQLDSKIAKSLVDAAGDLIYGSANDTVTRLGIGTAGQYLKVNSGATAPEWATLSAGGITLLSTTSLSGATTTISGIDGTYTDLKIVIYGVSNATADGLFRCAPNGTTNIASFLWYGDYGGSFSTQGQFGNNNYVIFSANSGLIRTSTSNSWEFFISNYSSTVASKPYRVSGRFEDASGTNRPAFWMGGINTTSAITSLVFSNSGGNLSTGTVLIYGVK